MRTLKYEAPGKAVIESLPAPDPGDGQVLCRSLFCSVSAGTEMGFYRGTAPQLNSKSDSLRNFHDAPGAITYPMRACDPGVWWMGYGNVGEIVKTGRNVKTLKTGDIVFTGRGHCDYHIAGENDVFRLPDGADPERASLLSLTEIAFNGILDTEIRLSETVVVFGLGVVGQLVLRMAKLSGAKVIAVDALPRRLDLAAAAGADKTVNFKETDTTGAVLDFTEGRGVDAVIEASGSVDALTAASKACCYNGRLVVLSFYQRGADSFFMGKEFHHKRLRMISSQVCGLSPSLGGVWDSARRRRAAFELLSALQIDGLINLRTTFEKLPETLSEIDRNPASFNAVTVKY